MKASFYPQQAVRQAVIQAQESTHQNEINSLKQELESARQQISSLQSNNNGFVVSYQNEISKLKTENQKLQNTVNQQKAHIEATLQNSKAIKSEDKSKVKELEKSLVEKDKDLSKKDGVIKGLKDSIQIISSLNLNKLNLSQKSGVSNETQDNLQKLLGGLEDVNDIQTVKSQIIGNNNASNLSLYDESHSFSILDE